MTVRATNDKLTDGTTRAPLRSSLPQGYRSIPSALWINNRARFSKVIGSESVPMVVGDRFLFNSVTCAARRLALMNLQGNRHACFGAFQDTRGGCAIKKSCEATFDAQTGWPEMSDHPVRSYQRTPSAIFLDVASTPPLEEGTSKLAIDMRELVGVSNNANSGD
jgi:hypothetical protein